MKRRKPDIMVLLALLVGMGVLATSLAQGGSDDLRPPATLTSAR
jgi:hypothetical protein